MSVYFRNEWIQAGYKGEKRIYNYVSKMKDYLFDLQPVNNNINACWETLKIDIERYKSRWYTRTAYLNPPKKYTVCFIR
jgi:hypothetical protein